MASMLSRVVAISAIGFAVSIGFGATAGAEALANQPSAADLDQARQAAGQADIQQTLGRFFARTGHSDADSIAVAAMSPTSVPVYELTPEFVAGAPNAQLGSLAYIAVTATATDGNTATVWTVRGQNGWEVGNIASGSREEGYAKQVPASAYLFHEPQTDSWYSVSGSQLQPLAGGSAITLADYQKSVASRFGDKLPGSDYANDGRAGGYGPGAMHSDTPPPVPAPAPANGLLIGGLLLAGLALIGVLAWRLPAVRRR